MGVMGIDAELSARSSPHRRESPVLLSRTRTFYPVRHNASSTGISHPRAVSASCSESSGVASRRLL